MFKINKFIFLLSVLILCQLGVFSISDDWIKNAHAEPDMYKMDINVENLEIVSLTANDSSSLAKLTINFNTNNETNFSLGHSSMLLIYAQPDTLPEDLFTNKKDNIIETYGYINKLKLEDRYPNSPIDDCKRLQITVTKPETRVHVCFEIKMNSSKITEDVVNEQFFVKINASSSGSSCPNCIVILLDETVINKNLDNIGPIDNLNDLFDEKQITVNQECNNGELYLHVINQNGTPVDRVHFTNMRGETYVVTDENGIAVVPPEKQGRLMKIFKGSYIPEVIQITACPNDSKEIIETNQEAEITEKKIPTWIRNNAAWWAQNQIDDSTFVSGIQFLIKEGVITIPEPDSSIVEKTTSNKIPDWVKNNADWWGQNLLSDGDFLKGIEYLVKTGIIVIPE